MLAWIKVVVIMVLVVAVRPAHAVPVKVPYSGQLAENGELVNGTKRLTFQICKSDTCARADNLYEETQSVVVSNGAFSVQIGSDNKLESEVLAKPGLVLRIAIETKVLLVVPLPHTRL